LRRFSRIILKWYAQSLLGWLRHRECG
jgi:hypothetical protein